MNPTNDSPIPRRPSITKKDAQLFSIPSLGIASALMRVAEDAETDLPDQTDLDSTEDSNFSAESPTAPWIVSGPTDPSSPRLGSKPVLQRTRPFRSLNEIFSEAWNYFDESEEREANNVSATVSQAMLRGRSIRRMPRRRNLSDSISSTASTSSSGTIEIDKFIVTPAYKGPTLPDYGPPTDEFIGQLINSFKNNVKLHYKYAYRLILEIKDFLENKSSTVTDVEVPEEANLAIVGDLHGQLDDFLTALKISGLPSATNWILFNGDFVDRGPHSLQVLLILYALKLAFPSWVFLNRGNHEHRFLNSRYLFELQVKQTYDSELYELIQETFNLLPLATLCTFPNASSASTKSSRVKRVLVIHGGLPQYEDFTIDELRTVPRIELPRHAEITTREQSIVESILWSDPGSSSELFAEPQFGDLGWVPNRRGAGIYFGKKLTHRFCKANDIDLIIRSHQMVENGYEFRHEKRLVTLFSASRYCRVNDNKGAVALIEGATGKLKFHSYWASPDLLASSPALEKHPHLAGIEPGAMIRVEQENAALGKISNRIFLKRHKLLLEFSKLDTEGTGKLTIDEWGDVLTRVLRVDLHWIALWPYLGYFTEEFATTPRAINEGLKHPEKVEYVKFLDEYNVEVDSNLSAVQKALEEETISKICSVIFTWSSDIREAFTKLDKKGIGAIPYHSFVTTLKRLKVGLSSSQMYDFVRSIDADGDGLVNLNEFISVFEDEFNRVISDREADKQFVQQALSQLARTIMRDRRQRTTLKDAFARLGESSGKKGIPYEVFVSTLQTDFHISYTDAEMRLLFDSIDCNANGHLSFKEFKAAFTPIMRSATMRALRVVKTNNTQVQQAGKSEQTSKQQQQTSSQAKEVPAGPTRASLAPIFAKIQKYRNSIMSIFVTLDDTGLGLVSAADVSVALSAITTSKKKKQVISDELIESIRLAFSDVSGKFDYHRFLMSFSVTKPVRPQQPSSL